MSHPEKSESRESALYGTCDLCKQPLVEHGHTVGAIRTLDDGTDVHGNCWLATFALNAEVERLRAVVTRIADMRTSGTAAHTMKSLARVALDRSAL
jgi:hypothetical protein